MTEITRRSVLTGAASAAVAVGPMAATRPAAAQSSCPTNSLQNFLAAADAQRSSDGDRKLIVDQATELLKGIYAHLPLKRAKYGIDPLEDLRRLRQQLPPPGTDRPFHAELVKIFASLHDMHTVYMLPEPYASAHAWLPFKVEACTEDGQRKYIVSRVVDSFVHPTFRPGVEVKLWNGVPVERAADLLGAQGANPAAQRALGLARLTYRALRKLPPPSEDAVSIQYLAEGQQRDISVNWQVTRQPDPSLCGIDDLGQCTEISQLQQFRKFLYTPYSPCQQFDDERVPSPDGNGAFGYIRVFAFDGLPDQAFVDDFKARVTRFAGNTRGLIVDVRDNGGGSTRASERIIQFVKPTREPIEPGRLRFVATPVTLRFCTLPPTGAQPPKEDVGTLGPTGLTPWIPSIQRALQNSMPYSDSFEYTAKDKCNDTGRIYPGPVIVVTNALTYSAAEMFAAGFQDHGGMILGVDETTGGGGAGVREDFRLRNYFLDAGKPSPFAELPGQTAFMVAFRRAARVGSGAGKEIEDAGVSRNHSYAMTRNDLLNHNADLKKEAARLLAQMPAP
jgi:C-terminal processing protease CtpA/Prc